MTHANQALVVLSLAAALALPAPAFAQASSPKQPPAKPQATKPAPAEPAPAEPAQDPLAPLLAQAQDALDHNDYAAAVPLIQKILVERPADAITHFELGYAYSELKQYGEAAPEYRRAIALDPKLTPAYLNLGLVLRDSDPAAAAEAFRQAAALQPDQGRPHYLAGTALERGGKAAEALAEYDTAVALAPKDMQMHLALGGALLSAGRAAEAEAKFREAVALEGDAAPAKLGLAESLLKENKNAEAVDALAAYLAAAPGDRHARFERAVALQVIDRFEDALVELDGVEQGAAPTLETSKLRASIYLEQSKWPEAAATLEKGVATWPGDAEMHDWLGRARMKLRDYPAAVAQFRLSLALDGRPVATLADLAIALYEAGQCPAAIAAFDLLDQRSAPVAVNWFARATCYDKQRQLPEAVAAYQKFIDMDQGHNPDQNFQARQRLIALRRELQKR